MNNKTALYSLLLLTFGAALLAKSPPIASRKSRNPPMTTHSSTPAPGIYTAVPYTAIVVIPAPTDRKFVASVRADLDRGAVVETPAIKLLPLHR